MPELDATMRGHAEQAVDLVRRYLKVELDYSPQSVGHVERMAALIYGRRRRPAVFWRDPGGYDRQRLHADEYGDPNPDWDPSEGAGESDDYSQVALALGAYIGEVIRRRWGGKWENPGQGARLRVGSEDLNPCGLAYFRVTRCHDNLREYFERVAKKLEGQKA